MTKMLEHGCGAERIHFVQTKTLNLLSVFCSLLCCLIKEIMKLEIREKRKKAYLDLFVFSL